MRRHTLQEAGDEEVAGAAAVVVVGILVLAAALAAGGVIVVVVEAALLAQGVVRAASGGDGGGTEREGHGRTRRGRLGEQLLDEAGQRGTPASDGGSHGPSLSLPPSLSLFSLLRIWILVEWVRNGGFFFKLMEGGL